MRIWTGGACAGPPGYGYGGWAWLMVEGADARGAAGGERHTTAGRMALRGMTQALAAAEPRAPIDLHPGDPGVARLATQMEARRAAGWRTAEDRPMEDAELWAALAAAVAARPGPVRFLADPAPGGAARLFVDAWLEFARDKTKSKGPFTSAIPRPNVQAFLAKHRESPP